MIDPVRNSPEDRRLRAAFQQQERRREAQDRARWDALERGGTTDARQAELEATLAENIEQAAAILQELAELDEQEPPAAPPAQPPLPGQRSLGPDDIARAIKDAPLGSETHMKYRAEYGISKPFVL